MHNTYGAYKLWFSHSYIAWSKLGHSIREIKNNHILYAHTKHTLSATLCGVGGRELGPHTMQNGTV